MAVVEPFLALRYNESSVGDLSRVICPPYDVITPQMEDQLHLNSEYNFIHLEYGRIRPQDNETENRYTRAAKTLKRWTENGVLEKNKYAAFYILEQTFSFNDRVYTRRNLFARVRLEEWDRMVIRPHEGTFVSAKSDRINLLWSLEANTSPVMALFDDKLSELKQIINERESYIPVSKFQWECQNFSVRQVIDTLTQKKIAEFFSERPLYIADGHHRYESALTYLRDRRTYAGGVIDSNSNPNFIMMALVDFNDSGLLVLPPHRLLRGISPGKINALKEKLSSFFEISAIHLNSDLWHSIDNFFNTDERVRLVLYGPEIDQVFLLTLRDQRAVINLMPYFHSEIYKQLDVSVLDHIILEKLLGLSGNVEHLVEFDHVRENALNKVVDGEYQLAFILKPLKPRTIRKIADVGDRMPKKSTYFFPKLPSGVFMYSLK